MDNDEKKEVVDDSNMYDAYTCSECSSTKIDFSQEE